MKQPQKLIFTSAQNIIAKQRGFNSYSDCCKQFYAWIKEEPVYVLLRQVDLSHQTYQINKHNKNIPYGQNSQDKSQQQRTITFPD